MLPAVTHRSLPSSSSRMFALLIVIANMFSHHADHAPFNSGALDRLVISDRRCHNESLSRPSHFFLPLARFWHSRQLREASAQGPYGPASSVQVTETPRPTNRSPPLTIASLYSPPYNPINVATTQINRGERACALSIGFQPMQTPLMGLRGVTPTVSPRSFRLRQKHKCAMHELPACRARWLCV